MSTLLFSMIFAHFLCNANAEIRMLSQEEALFCSSNFEELKLALNPNIEPVAFQQMELGEKAKVSVESYRFYKSWLIENAVIADGMRTTASLVAHHEPTAVSGQGRFD